MKGRVIVAFYWALYGVWCGFWCGFEAASSHWGYVAFYGAGALVAVAGSLWTASIIRRDPR